jgi:hypothetical protein
MYFYNSFDRKFLQIASIIFLKKWVTRALNTDFFIDVDDNKV